VKESGGQEDAASEAVENTENEVGTSTPLSAALH